MANKPVFTQQDLRERARRFIDFRSVAVIGASEDSARIGGKPLSLLRRFGFDGEVYGVNPKYDNVQGYPCVSSIEELPDGIELAIIAVAAPMVVGALESLGKKGVQAATIFSSGFAETGPEGVVMQRRMNEIAHHYGIAVNGPNCVGTLSFVNNRPATFASTLAVLAPGKVGRVALLSQSGGFATNIWADAMLSGTGFSHLFSTGNEAVLGFGDYLALLADDPDTDLVIGYIEGLEDGPGFCAAAEALRRAGKPLVLLKSGRSADVARVVASHTGQMAGNHEAFRAAFKKHGVIEAETLEDLIDHARVLSRPGLSDPITIATTSGGTGIYLADLCEASGVQMAVLGEETERRLREIVPSFGTTKNPVDLTAQVVNDSSGLDRALVAMCEDGQTGTLLFVLIGKAEEDKAREVIDIVTGVQARTGKNVPTAWLGVPYPIREMASKAGIDIFTDPARLIRPLSSLRKWKAGRDLCREAPGAKGTVSPGSVAAADMVTSAEGPSVLDEWRGMELLARGGIGVPSRWRIDAGGSFDAQAKDVIYPCVAKMLTPVLMHKSRAGGVITGIQTNGELRAAWERLRAIGARSAIVEAQISSSGPELVIGVSADPTFGQRVVIGAGGVNTNDEGDFVTLIPPLDREYVESALRGLRVWRRIEAVRQTFPDCTDWVCEAADRLCRLQHAEQAVVTEIECNPMLFAPLGLIAVDAVVVGGSNDTGEPSPAAS